MLFTIERKSVKSRKKVNPGKMASKILDSYFQVKAVESNRIHTIIS